MNQILATHNDTHNKKAPIDTRKIIVFFCVAVIIFAIILISVVIYNINEDKKQQQIVANVGKPKVAIERIEDSIKISAEYEYGMSNIKYIWNDEDSHVENLNGSTTFEKLIDIIDKEGENTLKVEVTGQNNTKNEVTDVFIVEVDSEEDKPIIQWVIKYEENKIIAVATDETELKYIKYQWDNGEAQTIEPEETLTRLEANIDIERGQHKLIITAEDKEGNISTKSGTFKGVKKPEISAIKYGDIVEITVSHDMGFKKIEFIINDMVYVYNENYAGYNKQNTSLLYKAQLKEGENVIQVTAESLETINTQTEEGTTQIYKGKCVYIPEINTNE